MFNFRCFSLYGLKMLLTCQFVRWWVFFISIKYTGLFFIYFESYENKTAKDLRKSTHANLNLALLELEMIFFFFFGLSGGYSTQVWYKNGI